MQRQIQKTLALWKNSPTRMPLILRGARQVGKSFIIRQFGKTEFPHLVEINFEQSPKFKACFQHQDLAPKNILLQLEGLSDQTIIPGKTLLFFDEIQECPEAILALRYFKEAMPELHVIGAGSLLEFTLNAANFRMPVGRIQFLQLHPLSFQEFLQALGKIKLLEFLEKVTLKSTIPAAIHTELLNLVKTYQIIGGMPAVVEAYINGMGFKQAQDLQTALLQTYRADFAKYSSHQSQPDIQSLFMKLPRVIAEQFQYSKVMPDARSREVKAALGKLVLAGLVYRVYAVSASGLPLSSLINDKKFKTLFLDTGLLSRAGEIPLATLLQEDLHLIQQGALMEQFVGQELLAYQDPTLNHALYFWLREQKGSTAEIDYVIQHNGHIIPIEVKSKSLGHLKSLHIFMREKSSKLGLVISQAPLNQIGNIASIPVYLLFRLEALLQDYPF